MRKFLILTLVLLFLSIPAFAAARAPDITLNVSGLVCDFCARAIEKVFMKQDGVTAVNVDLDNGKVTLDLKPGTNIDDKTLNKLMADSGYTVTGIALYRREKAMIERFFGPRHMLAPLASLLTSGATLVCCTLPALMVTLGMGAVLAGFLTDFPQLIWLSKHKLIVFGLAGTAIILAGISLWRARMLPCPADPAQAKICQRLRKASVVIYGFSVLAFATGAIFSFVMPFLLKH